MARILLPNGGRLWVVGDRMSDIAAAEQSRKYLPDFEICTVLVGGEQTASTVRSTEWATMQSAAQATMQSTAQATIGSTAQATIGSTAQATEHHHQLKPDIHIETLDAFVLADVTAKLLG